MYAVRFAIPEAIQGADREKLLVNLASAVQRLAEIGEAQWRLYAQGEPLPDGRTIGKRSGAYDKSIQRVQTGPTAWEVFSDAPYADAIERGTGPRDLRRMLDTSVKVRRTKDGRRYLVIPFHWGTGTGSGEGVTFGGRVMTADVHDVAKKLEPSRITGHGWRASGTGEWSVRTQGPRMVRQRAFHWGGRLSAGALTDIGLSAAHARRMAGMVKFQHPTRRGSRDTKYMTFRIMMEGGKGWQVPAQPGRYPARAVADDLNRRAARLLQAALAATQQDTLAAP